MKTDNMFCVHTTAFYRGHNCLISLWVCSSKQNIEPAIVLSTANCSRRFRCVLLASLNFFKLEMSRRKKQTTNARDKTAYFSWSDDEVELLQYLTLNKQLKTKLLSTTQKTSCCPPCWIFDRERFGKINHMKKWRERIQKVPDTKSSLSTLIEKSCVFKLFHSRERMRICAL